MKDRRRYPRTDVSLPIKLSDNDFDAVSETTNLSGSGVYCSVNRDIALMSKLRIVFLVPISKGKKRNVKKITCGGVVVRKECDTENMPTRYRIGIFFNDITDGTRRILLSYIKSVHPSYL